MIVEPNLEDIEKKLGSAGSAVPAARASTAVPDKPGLYSIFVREPSDLPAPFSDEIRRRGTTLIYLGKASNSLKSRLAKQDLCHTGPSTFFRAIGPILEYRPPRGSLVGKRNQNNYKFSTRDTQLIIKWIEDHLLVKWFVCGSPGNLEAELIARLAPLLNTQHNPEPLPLLAALRDECRQLAKSR